jgi:hypothetical protein
MDQASEKGGAQVSGSAVPAKSPGNNTLGRTGRDKDFLHIAEGGRGFRGTLDRMKWVPKQRCLVTASPKPGAGVFASYCSPVIRCRFPATEFLPSWNARVPEGAGFRVSMRVYDEEGQESPWFFMGEGGAWRKQADEVTSDDAWGKVRVDYLDLDKPTTAFQYKVEFIVPGGDVPEVPAELHRFFVHYSGIAKRDCRSLGAPELDYVRLSVPYRSQLDVEREDIRHVVCCPTCVAMVLESRGVNKSTLEICDAAYDERHKIYGIWPRASQAAFEHGVKSWVQRFRHLAGVRACLLSGQPIIASIRVGEGQLRGARYPSSKGHLIVIKGITETGKILCNDPYSAGPEGHEIEYEVEDIEKVWLDCGGVGIMVEKQG